MAQMRVTPKFAELDVLVPLSEKSADLSALGEFLSNHNLDVEFLGRTHDGSVVVKIRGLDNAVIIGQGMVAAVDTKRHEFMAMSAQLVDLLYEGEVPDADDGSKQD